MASVVLEMTLPVGHAPALHVHDNLDDTWYVLDGQMAGRCGDDEFFVEAGHWVSMPRGVPHVSGSSASNRPGSSRSTTTPPSATSCANSARRPPSASPPSPRFPPMDELVRVAGSHDLRPIGPPLTADQAAAIIARTGNVPQPA